MTAEQIEICKALGTVNYLSGSFDKRFGNNLCEMANDPLQNLSEKQNEWMYRLLYKYRKQLNRTYLKYKNNEFCNRKPRIIKP